MQLQRSTLEAYSVIFVTTLPITFSITGREYLKVPINYQKSDCYHRLPSYYRELKKYHLRHHFADYENGFGVTSRFWDRIFGTELGMPKVVKAT